MTLASPSASVDLPQAPALPLEVSQLKRQAARGIAPLIIRYGGGILINFAGLAVLSRLLGPILWGVFAVAQVLYLSSQEVLGRGVSTYLIRKDRTPTPADIRNTFALQHALGLLFLLGAVLLAHPAARWYGRGEITPLLLAAAVACYAFAWRSVPVALLERSFDYGKVALVELMESVLFSGVAIALALLGHPIGGLAIALLLRSILPTLLAYTLLPIRPSLLFHWNTLGGVADFGLSMAAGSLVNIAMLSIPVLVVGKLAGMQALGVARMGFGLYSTLLFLTAAILRLSFATYSRLAQHPGELQASVDQHLQIVAIILVPVIVVFAGLSPRWVPLLLGPAWRELPALLLALAPGYFLAAVFWGILSPALLVSGMHRQLTIWLAALAVTFAALTWALTPRWGAMGTAAAFSVVEVGFHPFLFRMYARIHGMFAYRAVATELAIAGGFVGALWAASRFHPTATAGLLFLYFALWCARNARAVLALRKAVSSAL